MTKSKAQVEDDELDTSFLESEEYARKSREVLKKLMAWLKDGKEAAKRWSISFDK